jgi:hypothetical protein
VSVNRLVAWNDDLFLFRGLSCKFADLGEVGFARSGADVGSGLCVR